MNETYADLEIRILEERDEGYPVELTLNQEQEFGPGTLDPGFLPWVPSASPSEDGQRLFEWLFADDKPRTAWDKASEHRPHRIRLRIDATAPELHAVPWELMQEAVDEKVSRDLAADADTPFSRYPAGDWLAVSPIAHRPIKILVAIANADNWQKFDLAPIDVETEQSIIADAFPDLTQGQVKLSFLEQPVTLSRLEIELKRGYDFLHIVAHGRYSERQKNAVIFLTDDTGQIELEAEGDIAEMIDRLSQDQKPKFIFLASCQSASRDTADAFRGLAPSLIKIGVPTVLAMQDFVPVKTAREFTRILYRQLFLHGQVDLASNEARSALLTGDYLGSSIPVLFSRLRDNQLLLPLEGDAAPVIKRKSFEPETVLIPAGVFLMGSLENEASLANELPQHEVELRAYRIGKYPVTNAEYAQFVKHTQYPAPQKAGWFGRRPQQDKNDHPVVGVTWYDALAYFRWLSEQTGRTYRLPTEAEWEKAARGVDGRIYPWGDEWDAGRCNCAGRQTTPVSAYPSGQSTYACYDMIGNVWEWTSTLWGSDWRTPEFNYPYQVHDGREDLAADTSVFRLFRGGSFEDKMARLRCAARRWYAPEHAGKVLGFRVLLEI